jgi:hypothetical protein
MKVGLFVTSLPAASAEAANARRRPSAGILALLVGTVGERSSGDRRWLAVMCRDAFAT